MVKACKTTEAEREAARTRGTNVIWKQHRVHRIPCSTPVARGADTNEGHDGDIAPGKLNHVTRDLAVIKVLLPARGPAQAAQVRGG